MALWWLCGGYVFPVVVKPENLFCTFGQNLVILAWMGGELGCGQAQNGVNLDFQVKLDLEGQGRSLHKKIGTLIKVLCIFGSKFGNPSWNGSWDIARTSKWLMHRHTHRQTQATTIPEGQNWPRVKSIFPNSLWRLWTSKWLTHRHTHRQTQATTIPGGQNWPWVKSIIFKLTLTLQMKLLSGECQRTSLMRSQH